MCMSDIPLTIEEAWTQENDCKVVVWNTQVEQDCLKQENQNRLAQDEEDAHQAQSKKEAEEQRKEAESKKPRANMFNPKHTVSGTIDPRPATYAISKVGNLEYIKLDYFMVRSCREA